MGVFERTLFDGVIEDVLKNPPKIFIVEHAGKGAAIGAVTIDLVAYFSQDKQFAELWKEYRFLTQIGDFRFYERRGPERHDERQQALQHGPGRRLTERAGSSTMPPR